MARHSGKRSLGGWLLGMAIINCLPLGTLFWVGYALTTGRTSVEELTSAFPEGSGESVLFFGGSLVLLILTTTLLIPATHGSAKALARRLAATRNGRPGVLDVVLWLPRQMALRLFQVLRMLTFGTALLCVLICTLTLIRVLSPGFLEEWVPLGDGWHWVREQWDSRR